MEALNRMVTRLQQVEGLDRVSKPVSKAVQRAVRPRLIRNLLSGTYVGHPVHPVLTDVPIGAWTMSAMIDLFGGRAGEPAADLLMKVGVLSAVPTAAAGLNDWSDTMGEDKRVGLVHAGANTVALGFYLASLRARARDNRSLGKALALAGMGMLLASGYLGGHLAYARAVNVNRTAWQEGPNEWTPVLSDLDLPEGESRTVRAGDVAVLVHRGDGRVSALAATCSHMGGPLGEGEIDNGCVTCPWHGSTFRLVDGGIVRGPASAPQPCYETRIRDGNIEVRLASGNRSDRD